MKLSGLKVKMTTTVGRIGLKAKQHSPELLLGAGVVGVIAGTFMVGKASMEAVTVLEESKEKIEEVEEVLESGVVYVEGKEFGYDISDEYTEDVAQADIRLIKVQTAAEIIKLYAPSVFVITVSLGAIIGGHRILRKRNVAVMAAYAGLDEAFKAYRQRVAEEYGEEVEELLYLDLDKKRKDIVRQDEDGKETKKKEDVLVGGKASIYSKLFDEYNPNWQNNPEFNKLFLLSQQNYANDILHSRGHLFLNEVYDMLGMEHTQAGAVVGWVVGNGDNFVDFGLYEVFNNHAGDFLRGEEASVLLDFNVDGVIYDKLDWKV